MRLLFPLSTATPITSGFGWRMHPISRTLRFHAGLDLGAPLGTPVVAAYSGQAIAANWLGGYGIAIVIRHEDGQLQTLYGHLSEIFVQPGDRVEQGEVIGRVGSTGNSTGPHLHFEVQIATTSGYQAIDAMALLNPAVPTAIASERPSAPPIATRPPARPTLVRQNQQPLPIRKRAAAPLSQRKTAPIKSRSVKANPALQSTSKFTRQAPTAASSFPVNGLPVFAQAVLAAVASDRLQRKQPNNQIKAVLEQHSVLI